MERSIQQRCVSFLCTSTRSLSNGPDASTKHCYAMTGAVRNGSADGRPRIHGCSPTGVSRGKRLDNGSRVNREVYARLCVQRRLACAAGDKPAGARVRSPVAWIAERRETEFLKPIDDRLPGRRASHRAVMKMNVDVASKVKKSEGRARNREGEGSMNSRNLADAAVSLRRGGSDSTMTRTCRATGETLLAPARNRWRRVGPITGEPGK